MRKWPLLPLPLLLIAAGLLLNAARGPSYLAQHMEPEYAYLFSSLNLAEGKATRYADHPGIPVQLFGAGLLRLRHPLDSRLRAESALRDPEKHIKTMGLALLLCAAVGLWWAGLLAVNATGSLGAALAFQALPFFSPSTLGFSLGRFSPEPLLLAITLPFCALLLSGPKPRFWGVLAACGLATKLTFAPVALLPLFLLSRRDILRYCAWTAGIFMLLTLPMAPLYPDFLKWAWQLLTGKGFYGQHGFGFVQSVDFWPSFLRIADTETAYMALLALLAALLIRAKLLKRGSPGSNSCGKLAWGLLITGALGIVLAAKLYSPRYLIPCVCSASAAAALLYTRADIFALPAISRLHKQVLLGLLGMFTLVSLWNFTVELRFLNLSQRSQLEFASASDDAFSDYPKAYFYPVSSQLVALFDGNVYGGAGRGELLEQLYPLKNTWFVHRFLPELWTWTGPADTETLLHNPQLIFIGNSKLCPSPLPGLTLYPILKSNFANDETASVFRRS